MGESSVTDLFLPTIWTHRVWKWWDGCRTQTAASGSMAASSCWSAWELPGGRLSKCGIAAEDDWRHELLPKSSVVQN